MRVEKLISELEDFVEDTVLIEIGDVHYPVHRIDFTSNEAVLVVDRDIEERKMRVMDGPDYDELSDEESINDFLDRARNGGAL